MSMLDPIRTKAALARTVTEWMEIYLEVLEANLKQIEQTHPEHHGRIFAEYQQTARPQLRHIAKEFQKAGLSLSEEMEFEGPEIGPFGPNGEMALRWPDPAMKVTYFWPDGKSKLSFEGEYAQRSIGFFMFWQNYQTPLMPAQEGGKRILTGGAEYDNYFKNKKADQSQGLEPDE